MKDMDILEIMTSKKKKSNYRWRKLLFGIVGTTFVGIGAYSYKNLPFYIGENVVEVVDGDFLIIANRQPIRLYGINAPELDYCLGKDAKDALTPIRTAI